VQLRAQPYYHGSIIWQDGMVVVVHFLAQFLDVVLLSCIVSTSSGGNGRNL
jgi:hypothetical protein